jgi:hypothetical protein
MVPVLLRHTGRIRLFYGGREYLTITQDNGTAVDGVHIDLWYSRWTIVNLPDPRLSVWYPDGFGT